MSEEVDFWSPTIAAYAPLQLSSPEMTPKLLKRPPFRFIHDIVCGIDARFAAYSHIIPPELQDSTNVDTKEKKIKYLTILLEYVNKLMGVQLDVSPKKIVSGHEPEKTNVFLQYLAAAVGYAQQDKAQKEAARTSTRASTSPSQADEAKLAAQSGSHLPSRDSLPRRASSTSNASPQRAANAAAVEKAEAFSRKLEGFSLNLNSKERRDVRQDGQSIVKMWNELANPTVETKPSHMPTETLEMAIDRQMETIKMVNALLQESDDVINELEALASWA